MTLDKPKEPMTAQWWWEKDEYAFIAEHNYGPDDPFFLECEDAPGFCCCSVCQGISGPGGARYYASRDDE